MTDKKTGSISKTTGKTTYQSGQTTYHTSVVVSREFHSREEIRYNAASGESRWTTTNLNATFPSRKKTNSEPSKNVNSLQRLFESTSAVNPKGTELKGQSSHDSIGRFPGSSYGYNTSYNNSRRNTPVSPRTAFNPSYTTADYNSGSISNPTHRPSYTFPAQKTSTLSEIPTYSIQGPKLKGKALIINNIKFMEKEQERKGAKKDGNDLKALLSTIGFTCTLKENLKGQEIIKEVSKFSKSNFKNDDIIIVTIMSHGTNVSSLTGQAVRGGYTEISGIDNKCVASEEIIEKFVNSTDGLKGKPKIFIFQCCRGDVTEIHRDAVPISRTQQHSDILIAHSTLPGYLSNRDPLMGSWYIQSICEVFRSNYERNHIEDMLKLVNQQLSNKHPTYGQTSTYESRGFNRCYLYKRKE
ncbi:caspase-1-like [Sitophilus oryzae]|uniref:Caspase-1-like n=1 Tax=Sitophilus oryzae TaxID=7048 RepID=A0A6J2Y7P9_SITOR|nr:caspase-1-like [Sitophilus oryzae]